MATGHYCKIEERNGRKVIVKAEDDKKRSNLYDV